ncbi:hypothetical protein ACIHAR_28515 [Streptomyces sp. NPDC052016]|uniref:hypothetical protein n=1 Tax=Streptomyces sp. NPDC052016 TaxID=3365680 RepID=UPI0037CD1361
MRSRQAASWRSVSGSSSSSAGWSSCRRPSSSWNKDVKAAQFARQHRVQRLHGGRQAGVPGTHEQVEPGGVWMAAAGIAATVGAVGRPVAQAVQAIMGMPGG